VFGEPKKTAHFREFGPVVQFVCGTFSGEAVVGLDGRISLEPGLAITASVGRVARDVDKPGFNFKSINLAR
jgi:hypothetical protein